jgi:hypothetical protein
MFCPTCGEEFAWDVMVCPTCDVDTVDRLPGPEPTPDVQLVSVFASADPGVVAVAKSLLDGEEIDYFVRGDGVQDMFPSSATGPAQFWVREDDADRARELLQELSVPLQDGDPSHEA